MQSVTRAPKALSVGEGESFQMLSHTFTSKITAEDTLGKWIMYEATDTIGNGAPMHSHPWEETFYILEGELEIQIGKRVFSAKAGASVYFPENCVHGFKVCSETVRLLTIMPAFADAFYREMGEKITSLPPDLETFQAVASKHEVRLFL
jgi:mannose-6-phosphate isomerase-like protein (cupin superfamily)